MRKKKKCISNQKYYSATTFLSSYVKHIKKIVKTEPFLSIILTSCGIEFLGKCISKTTTWDQDGLSRIDYEAAINKYESFKKYRAWLKTYDLYSSLRCSPVHSLAPSKSLVLVNDGNNHEDNGVLYISATQYLNDFSIAAKAFRNSKKNGGKSVDDPIINVKEEGSLSSTGVTQNYPSAH